MMASFINRNAQGITAGNCSYPASGTTGSCSRGPSYPPEWDLPDEPETRTELRFWHYDLVEETECCGCFVERTVSIPDSERALTYYRCNECSELRTLKELSGLAEGQYGEEWVQQCTVEVPDVENLLDWLD
jgi:hypothetical protein